MGLPLILLLALLLAGIACTPKEFLHSCDVLGGNYLVARNCTLQSKLTFTGWDANAMVFENVWDVKEEYELNCALMELQSLHVKRESIANEATIICLILKNCREDNSTSLKHPIDFCWVSGFNEISAISGSSTICESTDSCLTAQYCVVEKITFCWQCEYSTGQYWRSGSAQEIIGGFFRTELSLTNDQSMVAVRVDSTFWDLCHQHIQQVSNSTISEETGRFNLTLSRNHTGLEDEDQPYPGRSKAATDGFERENGMGVIFGTLAGCLAIVATIIVQEPVDGQKEVERKSPPCLLLLEYSEQKSSEDKKKEKIHTPKKASPPPAPVFLRKMGAKRSSGGVTIHPQVAKLFREVTRRGPGSSGKKGSISGKTGNQDSVLQELKEKSEYSRKVAADVRQYDQVIKNLIKDIHCFKATTLKQLFDFVNSCEDVLSKLYDEPAVLKSFDWPSKYYILREANEFQKEMANLKAKFLKYNVISVGTIHDRLGRIEKYLEKCVKRMDQVLKEKDEDEKKFKGVGIPWNWKVVQEVKHASLSLLEKYMAISLDEVRKLEDQKPHRGQDKKIMTQLTGAICFTHKVHQFAGGLNQSCIKKFEVISAKTQALTARSTEE